MGFFSDVAGRIRNIWAKDKSQVPLQLAKGTVSAGYPNSSYDILQAYGHDALGDYLRLEMDLLSRYCDYEEMDDYGPISQALTILADDSTQPNVEQHKTIWVSSSDKTVAESLDDLFNKRLRMDEDIWEIARTMCLYGNDMEEVLVTENGVVGLNHLPPPTVRRIEGLRGELYGFVQDYRGRFSYTPEEFKQLLGQRTAMMRGNTLRPGMRNMQGLDPSVTPLEDWEVIHLRLRGKHRRSLYGVSALESARWIFKRLILLEDSAMLYRLQRAPERFAFYVDTGDLPPDQALAHVRKVRSAYKKKKIVDPVSGKLDLKFNSLGQDEDFFLPSREGKDGTRVEVLAGPVWQHMEDIDYFLSHLFTAMGVPKAYLAQDENINRSTLSSQDVRFSRSVLRIQRELQNGLRKIARIDMAARGIDPFKVEYDVHMTVPSSIFELAQLEVRTARADLASRMREFVDLGWLYEHVFGLSDEDAKIIERGRERDVENQLVWQAKGQAKAEKFTGGDQQPGAAPGMSGAGVPGGQGEPGPGMPPKPETPQKVPPALMVQDRGPGIGPGLLRSQQRGITEQEMFRTLGGGSDRRASQKLDRLLENDKALAHRLAEIRELVQMTAQMSRGRR